MNGNTQDQEHLQVSKMNDTATERISTQIFDFSGYLHPDRGKEKIVRQMLRRYKANKCSDQEKRILAEAMGKYQLSAENDTDKRAFNVLLLSYFSIPTLTALQISEQLHIAKRTIFKDISKGVGTLRVLIFGIDAFSVTAPDETAFLSEVICKCIHKELREEVEKCLTF